MAPPPGGSSLSGGLSGGLSGDLFDAAFGADTARWPLPAATDDEQLWLRAVAAGGHRPQPQLLVVGGRRQRPARRVGAERGVEQVPGQASGQTPGQA